MAEAHKCSRLIGISKYERTDPETRQWWGKLFAALEAEAAIPPDRREEVLREIFPEEILIKILSRLSFIKADVKAEKATEIDPSLLLGSFVEGEEGESCRSSGTNIPSLDIRDPPSQYHVIPTRQQAEYESPLLQALTEAKRRRVGQNNPYLRFFKRREDKAQIWRPPPPLSLEEMNLTQKAEAIAEMIAADFVAWVTEMSGTADLKVEHVVKMFDIGFDTHAAHSLCVKMIELPAVPQMVADAVELPHLSRRACLHRLIRDDIKAAKKKKLTVAFGRSLPMEMQVKPTKDDIARKWLHCDNVPVKLQSMAAVWEGITHLRSTREFCEYIIEHPLMVPPKYLVDSKMLDIAYLRRPHRSLESEGTDEGVGEAIPAGLEEKVKEKEQQEENQEQ